MIMATRFANTCDYPNCEECIADFSAHPVTHAFSTCIASSECEHDNHECFTFFIRVSLILSDVRVTAVKSTLLHSATQVEDRVMSISSVKATRV